MLTVQEVDQALSALGDTTLKVAARLRRRGIAGRRKNAQDCPIANYLRLVLDRRDMVVLVNGYSVGFFPGSHATVPTVATELPVPVQAFIRSFDRGGHPALLRP